MLDAGLADYTELLLPGFDPTLVSAVESVRKVALGRVEVPGRIQCVEYSQQ
jgi:hypothetical protein